MKDKGIKGSRVRDVRQGPGMEEPTEEIKG